MATEEDKTNNGALFTLVAVGLFSMIGICLAVTAVERDEVAALKAEREGPGNHAYYELRSAQKAKLAAGVPIEQAMQQVVQSLQRDPSSATPPPPPAAEPAAAPAPAASAAPAAADGAAAPAPSAAPTPSAAAAPAPSAAPASSANAATPARVEKKSAPAAPEPKKAAPPAAAPAPQAPGSAHG